MFVLPTELWISPLTRIMSQPSRIFVAREIKQNLLRWFSEFFLVVWATLGIENSQTKKVTLRKIWSRMIHYGPIWSHMVPYGPVWSRMVLFGPIWSCSVPFGPVWSSCNIRQLQELAWDNMKLEKNTKALNNTIYHKIAKDDTRYLLLESMLYHRIARDSSFCN